MTPNPPGREVYSVGYGGEAHRWHLQRTAEDRAGFLLGHLRAGMTLLDCGCGPGSITEGLARAVAPGLAVGVDLEPRQIERARAVASSNLCFAVGDVYALPFAGASFHAVFAHNLLEHLADPLRALKEMRRVLRPSGVLGVRDPDFGLLACEPSTPLLREASSLLLRIRQWNGGSPYYARHQRRLLLEAGCARTEGFAFVECQGTAEATRAFAQVFVEVLCAPANAGLAIREGWADEVALQAMAAEVRTWSERPDAYSVVVDCAALGWA